MPLLKWIIKRLRCCPRKWRDAHTLSKQRPAAITDPFKCNQSLSWQEDVIFPSRPDAAGPCYFLSSFIGSGGNQTKGLEHARQILFMELHLSIAFGVLRIFFDIAQACFKHTVEPRLASDSWFSLGHLRLAVFLTHLIWRAHGKPSWSKPSSSSVCALLMFLLNMIVVGT